MKKNELIEILQGHWLSKSEGPFAIAIAGEEIIYDSYSKKTFFTLSENKDKIDETDADWNITVDEFNWKDSPLKIINDAEFIISENPGLNLKLFIFRKQIR